ncbi:MAG: hypothetical protein GTO41_06195 [Burkholderiales bacterium]|nr:hypothetical protein [Burkholderiales bacterium]
MAFTWLALQGPGGVIVVAQRVLVDEKQWLSRDQFVDILSLAQVLSNPDVLFVAVMGYRAGAPLVQCPFIQSRHGTAGSWTVVGNRMGTRDID